MGSWIVVEVHYFTSPVISPLSAFPFGLKLVDSCSVGRLLFYLHFLVFILMHRGERKILKCYSSYDCESF